MIVFDGLCRSTPAVPAWAPPRPAQVAECAGHPVDLLRKIYAKTLDGREEMARRRVTEAPGYRLSRSRTHRDPTYALARVTVGLDMRMTRLGEPPAVDYPLFVYGLLKPGELAYPVIKK